VSQSSRNIQNVVKELIDDLRAARIAGVDAVRRALNPVLIIGEYLGVSETVAVNRNLQEVSESGTVSDSVSVSSASRFELEQVDGSHSNEVVIKIGFWELLA